MLNSISSSDGQTYGYQYDNLARLTGIELPGGGTMPTTFLRQ